MKTVIEFETKKSGESDITASLWKPPGHSTYNDMILKPEYLTKKASFPVGKTWFRVIPALKDSRGWMIGVHCLDLGSVGRFAHAKSVIAGSQSVFDAAYSWFKTHHPELLFSKENKAGFRFLSKPLSVCWILVKTGVLLEAKIVVSSAYSGQRGGPIGLGHNLLSMVESVDENVDSPANPIDPESGVQFCVEKIKPAGAQYPTYRLTMGRQPAPISQFLAELSEEEVKAIRPLEEVIRVLTKEEEWQLLGQVVGTEYRDQIRSDSNE